MKLAVVALLASSVVLVLGQSGRPVAPPHALARQPDRVDALCSPATIAATAATVTAACCVVVNCSTGWPEVCSLSCAETFLEFMDNCGAMLRQQSPGVYQQCTTLKADCLTVSDRAAGAIGAVKPTSYPQPLAVPTVVADGVDPSSVTETQPFRRDTAKIRKNVQLVMFALAGALAIFLCFLERSARQKVVLQQEADRERQCGLHAERKSIEELLLELRGYTFAVGLNNSLDEQVCSPPSISPPSILMLTLFSAGWACFEPAR